MNEFSEEQENVIAEFLANIFISAAKKMKDKSNNGVLNEKLAMADVAAV